MEMKDVFEVYWYHLAEHTDPTTQGYIGVTSQRAIRERAHKQGKLCGAKILSQAFRKYGEENILRNVLHEFTDREEAYACEAEYRPEREIGWNIAVGGGLPPDSTGRVHSEETKRKISESNIGKGVGATSPFKGQQDRWSTKMRKQIGTHHKGKTISDAHRQAITEKISGVNHPRSKPIVAYHRDAPHDKRTFINQREAAEVLGLPYPTVRAAIQRNSGGPGRTGWFLSTV